MTTETLPCGCVVAVGVPTQFATGLCKEAMALHDAWWAAHTSRNADARDYDNPLSAVSVAAAAWDAHLDRARAPEEAHYAARLAKEVRQP